MTKQKVYVLQELQIIGMHMYWFTLNRSDDKEYICTLKKLYAHKNKNTIYQVVEVIA